MAKDWIDDDNLSSEEKMERFEGLESISIDVVTVPSIPFGNVRESRAGVVLGNRRQPASGGLPGFAAAAVRGHDAMDRRRMSSTTSAVSTA